MKVDIIGKAPGAWQGDARLVRAEDGRQFVASGVHAMFSGWEVLMFPANESGEVTDYIEVAGGKGMTHEEAIADLEHVLDHPSAD